MYEFTQQDFIDFRKFWKIYNEAKINNFANTDNGKGTQINSKYKGLHTFLSKDKKNIFLTTLMTDTEELIEVHFSKFSWDGFEFKYLSKKKKINNFSHFLELYKNY